ncbi:MAG: VCBS repeat-containing protein [Myxococcales bacterium]|nr:VCBS repeat-containing protein [Myxococcales bacterium]
MVQPGTGARSPGDFDGDGLDDLLRAAKGGLHVHWNDEDTFGPPDPFCLSDSLTEVAAGVASTDLDGDGLPDLIASTRNNQLVVLGGAGARRFREPLTLPSDSPGEVITADLDEDGELDMIVASALPGGGGQVEVHLSAE